MARTEYEAYQPQGVLQPIGPDIWIVEGPVLMWSIGVPVKWPFPTRMTVIRLDDGKIWIHSPVKADEKLYKSIEELGPVAHIVSPNLIHHVSIADWYRRFSEARVWASPGVRKRSEVDFTDDLEDLPPSEWSQTIDQRIAHGSSMLNEVVFFHKPSETLILADLIENFEPERLHGWFNHLMCRLGGIMAPHGKAPRDLRATFMGRHDQLRPAIEWMITCQPKQIVIAHGKWLRGLSGDTKLREAFSWVRGIDPA